MTTKRVTMQKIKDILRLTFEANLSIRKIAHCLNLSVGAASKYLSRAKAIGLGWPLPDDMTDTELAAKLQPPRVPSSTPSLPEPGFNQVHSELNQKGMTLQLAWQEYAEIHPSGHYSYSRFTVLYRQRSGK